MAGKKAYEEYLDIESRGSNEFEDEVTGYLVDLESPAEQDLPDFQTITLEDESKIEIVTGWRATLVDEDGVQHLWRWPAYKSKAGKNCLGTDVISQNRRLREIMNKPVLVHCYRSKNRRAHVELVED